MPRRNFKLSLKAKIVKEAEDSGNLRQTARRYKIQPVQIRIWRKNIEEITLLSEKSPKKLTLNKGKKSNNQELENEVYSWILSQREEELAVSAHGITDKALSIESQFHEGNRKKLTYWVYEYMKRRNLSIRTRTRKSQVTDAAMQQVKADYCRRVMTSFHNRINNPRYLINMDETAIYLNCSPVRTVHPRGEKTVSIMIGGTSSMRFTLAVTVAMDGSKLPLFVIFKGVPGGRVDKSLPRILPDGVIGCVQRKGWMDNYTMRI